jgi:hypothetical protein
MKPDWLPDWRDAANYPSNASRQQWAWEFLRRNDAYQQLWNEVVRPGYSSDRLNDTWTSIRERLHSGRRVRVRLDDIPIAKDRLTRQFHIGSYPPPAPEEPLARLQFDAQFIQYELVGGGGGKYNLLGTPKPPGEVVLWFNLNWPLGPQLANAKKVLEHHAKLSGAKSSRRIREAGYGNYLRVLDAKADGASIKEIANVLYPKLPEESRLQRVRDDLKAAERLRDLDFWQIAVSQTK